MTRLVQITDIIFNNKKKNNTATIKLQIENDQKSLEIIDLGQVTTIWWPTTSTTDSSALMNLNDESSRSENNPALLQLPLGHLDRSLDVLYNSYVGRARRSDNQQQYLQQQQSGGGGGGGPLLLLTKKQLSKIIHQAPPHEQELVDQVLRQVIKTGNGFARLVDSDIVREYLFDYIEKGGNDNNNIAMLELTQRAMSAQALSTDAALGGRFKRFGCLAVSCQKNKSENDESDTIVTLINGGWLVVDQNIRATAEAKKFVERSTSNSGSTGLTASMADDRIVTRLECLAMGDNRQQQHDSSMTELQVDVRETLRAMNLPTTANGAKEALIQIGHWTPSTSNNKKKQAVDPWSKSVMEAAKWYHDMNEERKKDLLNKERTNNAEGRTDLTQLPCVCVDATRTTFRDDAIGIRPRSSTGRRVTDASKWEILLHIADVSDLYSPQPTMIIGTTAGGDNEKRATTTTAAAAAAISQQLNCLREAASKRGTSRYDLPLGPLHLLPPIVLQSLSLTTLNLDVTSKAPIRPQQQRRRGEINRCVTLWVYIDDKTGKLLDAGLERTLISAPLALSYPTATALLDGTLKKEDPMLDKARALLRVAERNLNLWSSYHQSKHKTAQAREDRLTAREVVAKEVYGSSQSKQQRRRRRQRDDGMDGFQRSRGHRLVDSALNLYGFALNGLLQRSNAPVPHVAGNTRDRLGRIATAPLRRYIDGVAQRQALSVLCGYGGKPLTQSQAASEGKKATAAINAISNIKSTKDNNNGSNPSTTTILTNQKSKAIRSLKRHLKETKGPIPAMSTGHQNEVVILGVGAVASCKGIQGTLKPGKKIMVEIQKIDERNGRISAVLVPR
eukprot:scaffold2362_cov109-Cylindrotheca_fusiformis.AAC.9